MSLKPVAGERIYIGGVLDDKSTDFIASDFAAQSWTEIDGWSQKGQIGDTSELISTPLINRDRVIKQKGTKNAGSMQNVFAIIEDDPGQALVVAAVATKDNYAFKILKVNGDIEYFIGLVMGAQEAGGAANTVEMMNVTVEINSNIVEVDA